MILNVHERAVRVPPARLGAILESLAGPDDQFWRTDLIEPIVLDRGLEVGSRGGHGPVRYVVVEHDPARLVRFRFEPGIGLRGTHALEVVTGDDGSPALRHTIEARAVGLGFLSWPLIRVLHDAALEDMLDHVERSLTGTAHRGQRTPGWVRRLGRWTRAGR